MTTKICVSATVTSSNPETVTHTIEALTRAACGLALEGAEVNINVWPSTETADAETGD